MPQLSLLRIVTIEGCGPIPCGGTYVKKTEIKQFAVKGAEKTELGFKVYYDVQ